MKWLQNNVLCGHIIYKLVPMHISVCKQALNGYSPFWLTFSRPPKVLLKKERCYIWILQRVLWVSEKKGLYTFRQ